MGFSKRMLVGKAGKGERGAESGKRKVLHEDGVQMICWELWNVNCTLSHC